ncbi:type I-E CRISPR-associated protein Cse2/CasB [Actinomadura roseirufa]|uniref:type I-E CRISPR-associated protein Cse2/CasB n=1 Tax=Actinomadura roseirufa TaxID=2094049 RepID=UPI0010411AEB|nr:type I-E CRISPR-associated protein Cse2/CasB [Actinomadura roseirufa]
MTATIPGGRQQVPDLVRRVVGEFVSELQEGYLDSTSKAAGRLAVGRLAQLRRGAGKLPQDVPELWGLTGVELILQDPSLSEAQAVKAEAAVFLAVTLFALHQQSRPNQGMHDPDVDLGEAVRRLMPTGEIDEPIRRRFVRVGTAGSLEVLAYRLREIVSLLRRDSIPLDYARLAQCLYHAHTPEGLARVRQQWGRSFHSYRPASGKAAGTESGQAERTPQPKTDKDVT